jgi:ribosomal protein L6P/L9E
MQVEFRDLTKHLFISVILKMPSFLLYKHHKTPYIVHTAVQIQRITFLGSLGEVLRQVTRREATQINKTQLKQIFCKARKQRRIFCIHENEVVPGIEGFTAGFTKNIET